MKKINDRLAGPAIARRLAVLEAQFGAAKLNGGRRGIERETLRATSDGALALTPHPHALGSALTHPEITTDYAEALLEFITPPSSDVDATLAILDAQHRFVYSKLGDELMWNQSMPCRLPADEAIPLAYYGESNLGRFKHVYRHGLGLRYGRTMQCIAGIHFNYSVADELWPVLQSEDGLAGAPWRYQSEGYIALMRNYRRFSWLLLLLFGASPALDESFVRHGPTILETFDRQTRYLPFATSLRMSDIGYQNKSGPSRRAPHLGSLDDYLTSLREALERSHPPFEAFGTRREGQWLQLNTKLLQIENESYATVRPKQPTHGDERVLDALATRGVQYIEVRCLDIDPFEPLGIGRDCATFMDAFLLACALQPSPADEAIQFEADVNFATVAREGRRPGLMLEDHGEPIALESWAGSLLDNIALCAEALDRGRGTGSRHVDALEAQRRKIADMDLTPSARVLAELEEKGQGFIEFGVENARAHARSLRARPLPETTLAAFEQAARLSIEREQALRDGDTLSFEDYVARFCAAASKQTSVGA